MGIPLDKGKEKKSSDKVKDKSHKEKKSKSRMVDSDYASDHSSKSSPSRRNSDKEDVNAITVESKEDKTIGKKQHKIRRKLLMGGLIRRKNRSMPDLTVGQEGENQKATDDLEVRSVSRPTTPSSEKGSSMGGYLSEGHLEYSNPNPNLERSKLMRKSFHGSVGKVLSAATKVPPPIPQRLTSQLSAKNEKN